MGAPSRTTRQSIRQSLRRHRGIKYELDRLEKAANKDSRKALPWFTYKPGEVAELFLNDLAEVVSSNDWRPPLERTADRLRRAAKRICEAVGLLVRAADACPTYATIPSVVWGSTPEAKAEERRIGTLSFEDKLKAHIERQGRTVTDHRTIAPGFLKAMLVYSVRCRREADRLDGILKARTRHFDRLGPLLNLIQDVQKLTGKPDDHAIARLLTDAREVSGTDKQTSADSIRKIRQRHLAS
jgi:hypothetical protein